MTALWILGSILALSVAASLIELLYVRARARKQRRLTRDGERGS